MGAERKRMPKMIGRTTNILVLVVLAAFLMGWIFKTPEPRKHPNREPVYFWHMWTASWKSNVEAICDGFNNSQDRYEVIPLSLPQGVSDSKFLLAVTGGSPPDCMAQWHQVVPQFADKNLLMPLDEIMDAEELEHLKSQAYPIAQKIAFYNGRPYCMPLALDVRAYYYRLDHLHEAGLLPDTVPERIVSEEDYLKVREALPETLEQLTDWGRKLNVFDSKKRLVRMGFAPEWFRMFAPVFGGGFYDWEANELTINTPENLRTLTFLLEEQKAIGYERMARFTSSLTGNYGADWPFAIGKKSISLDGQWRVQQLSRFAPDVPYATSPIPPPEEGGRTCAGWVYGNFMVIPSGARNPEGAWAFIRFWTGLDDPDRAADFYVRSGWLPPRPQIAETARYRAYVREHPQFQTFLEILASPNIEPTPPVPFQLLMFDMIKRTDEAVMRGSLTPKEALEMLEEEVRDIQSRRKELRHET